MSHLHIGSWNIHLGDLGTWVGGIGSAIAAFAAVLAAKQAGRVATSGRLIDHVESRLDILLQVALAFEDACAAIDANYSETDKKQTAGRLAVYLRQASELNETRRASIEVAFRQGATERQAARDLIDAAIRNQQQRLTASRQRES